MNIFGAEHEEYLEICRKPFLAYLGWAAAMFVMSFVAFGAYSIIASGMSTFVYLGLAIYVAWEAQKKEFGAGRTVLVVAMVGIGVGFVEGIAEAVLLYANSSYAVFFDPVISDSLAKAAQDGMQLTREDVISGLALFSVFAGPFIYGFVFSLVAVAVMVGNKLIEWAGTGVGMLTGKGKSEPIENKKTEVGSLSSGRSPGKRFKKKKR